MTAQQNPAALPPIEVRIPASLVPRARIDYDAEARQILGFPLVLHGKPGIDDLRIPPLSAARLVALELVTSPFFLNPDFGEPVDLAAAIVLATCTRDALERLTEDPAELAKCAALILSDYGSELAARRAEVVNWIRWIPFYGLDMRPGGRPPRPRAFIFDGSFMGGVIAPAARILATPVESAIWDLPLCLIGHAVAQYDASNGVKGVERPPDLAVLDCMMQEAEDRERRGELHPWQRVDPWNYPLTNAQAQANPALIGEFAEIKKKLRPARNKEMKLDQTASAGEAGRTATVEAKLHG